MSQELIRELIALKADLVAALPGLTAAATALEGAGAKRALARLHAVAGMIERIEALEQQPAKA